MNSRAWSSDSKIINKPRTKSMLWSLEEWFTGISGGSAFVWNIRKFRVSGIFYLQRGSHWETISHAFLIPIPKARGTKG
jgi:hypothetical protein